MQNKKSLLIISNIFCALALMSSCSSKKDIPQGTRISVLEQNSSIKPEVADSAQHISIPAAVKSNTWLQKGSNAQHISYNYLINDNFKKLWSADFGKGKSKREFLLSRPLAEGTKIYTLDAEGTLSAFNAEDGEIIWAANLEPKNKHEDATSLKGVGLAKQGNVIYAVAGYGSVFAVNAKNGNIIWQKDLDTPLRISPTIYAGKLFIQSTDNKVTTLNTSDGEVLWEYDIALEDTTRVGGATPAYSADSDVVVTGFSNGEIQAFNASLGTALWSDILISNRQAYSSTFLHAIKADPIIENDIVYALGSSDIFVAIDLRSGERLWEKNIGGNQTPLLVGNTLYTITNQNELTALDKSSGKVLWATSVNLGKKSKDVMIFSPLMVNNHLLLTFSDGRIFTFDAKTGKHLKSADLDEDLISSPIISGDYIIFTTAKAKLIVFK